MKITLEFEFDKYDFENAVEIYAHQYNFSLDELSRSNAVMACLEAKGLDYLTYDSQLTDECRDYLVQEFGKAYIKYITDEVWEVLQ